MYSKIFRMPTPVKIKGRSSSITNAFENGIVPVCGKCNQSKGNREWKI